MLNSRPDIGAKILETEEPQDLSSDEEFEIQNRKPQIIVRTKSTFLCDDWMK